MLGCAMAPTRVYRGTLVHCKDPHKVEILLDHLIGVDEDDHGKVPTSDVCDLLVRVLPSLI